jgi:PAS domain S-box-containing protein
MPIGLSPDIYRAVLDCAPVGVYVVDPQRRIVFWNSAAERITGYLGQEVIGHFCHDNLLMHCDQESNILCGGNCPMANTMLDGQPRDASVFLLHKDGRRIPVRVRAVPVRDEFEAVVGSAEFFEESTFGPPGMHDRRRRAGSPHSDIPEIADRAAMLALVREALQKFTACEDGFGVLCAGIDKAAELRHTDGCHAARAVIYAAGQTMAAGIRPSDTVGLWNEQEGRFVVLIAGADPGALTVCAERLRRLVKVAAVPWWGDHLSVTLSVGGTLVCPGDTVESLMERARQALEACLVKGSDSVSIV